MPQDQKTMRAVLGLKPGDPGREYEAGPVIDVPGGPRKSDTDAALAAADFDRIEDERFGQCDEPEARR